jgi:hypothetical protein
MIQSRADEHASNGVATVWPTTGSIFNVAEVSRHGSAATPQPLSGSSAAPSVNHAATRNERTMKVRFEEIEGVEGMDTRTSKRQAVVSTLWPSMPLGNDGNGVDGSALSRACSAGAAADTLDAAGLVAGGVGDSAAK